MHTSQYYAYYSSTRLELSILQEYHYYQLEYAYYYYYLVVIQVSVVRTYDTRSGPQSTQPLRRFSPTTLLLLSSIVFVHSMHTTTTGLVYRLQWYVLMQYQSTTVYIYDTTEESIRSHQSVTDMQQIRRKFSIYSSQQLCIEYMHMP